MTKIDIISGFLGAGKTTLIKKLLDGAFKDQKVVLIENEFGEIGVDSGFLKDAGVQITEMNSGCICCTLVGDFGKALKQVVTDYAPDRVIIEPSGVGKLSDVAKAVIAAGEEVPMELGAAVAVVNGPKCKVCLRNFGEFFIDQVAHAGTILISRTQNMTNDKVTEDVELLRQHNDHAPIITTPWDELDAAQILEAMTGHSMAEELLAELAAHAHDEDEHEHHHHHHHDGEECDCDHEHHHHHDGEECDCGCEHHHHHDGEECDCGHEHHHHHDGEECDCGCEHHHHHDHDHEHEHGEECHCGHDHHHDHDHHHHHHADDIFSTWGQESPKQYTRAKLEHILEELDDSNKYGQVLRAKGIVPSEDGKWLHFDYTTGESEIREGGADYTGRLCVIGAELKEQALAELFSL